jgi:hypothetical protein
MFDGIARKDGLCYCGVDFDAWGEQEQALCAKLATYTETSPSRKGAHAIVLSTPFIEVTSKIKAPFAEAYSAKRYFAFTGHRLEAFPATIEIRSDEVLEVRNIIAAAGGRRAVTERTIPEPVDTEELTESALVNEDDFDDLGSGFVEPLDLEKLKAAMEALPNEWFADEKNWKDLCRVCANEAMIATENSGDKTPIDTMFVLLDERSKKGKGDYDLKDNRSHYDRFCNDYTKAKKEAAKTGVKYKPLKAPSLYRWARERGWDETQWVMDDWKARNNQNVQLEQAGGINCEQLTDAPLLGEQQNSRGNKNNRNNKSNQKNHYSDQSQNA